jgi:hypothetical protein
MTEEQRRCANCACHQWVQQENGQPCAEGAPGAMLLCRLNPAAARMARQSVPQVTTVDGKPTPVLDNKGRPRMQEQIFVQRGFFPVTPDDVCFAGWRPMGTPPGASAAYDGNAP